MSKFSLEQLQEWSAFGFNFVPWHGKGEDDTNVFAGPVPSEYIRERIFGFDVVILPKFVKAPTSEIDSATGIGPDGTPYVEVPTGMNAIVRKDTLQVVGDNVSDGFAIHDYRETLLVPAETISGDGLGIQSAMILADGRQGFVSLWTGQTDHDDETGVDARTLITLASSLDGSWASQGGVCTQIPQCDNTVVISLAQAAGSGGYKIKHTKNSVLRLQSAQEALGLMTKQTERFVESVQRLARWDVTTRDFDLFLDAIIPVPEEDGRGKTVATGKRDRITEMYRWDSRCAPWQGTAFGVLQTLNTYYHHERPTRKDTNRIARNVADIVNGKVASHDAAVLDTLAMVTGRALATV